MGSEPIKNLSLEHLYHGYLTQDGQPTGEPQLIAHSAGVAASQWKECLALAPLSPAGNDDTSGADSDVIGLFRGQTIDCILAHARRDWAENELSTIPTVHYILIPETVLDALSGNLNALQPVLEEEMPTFSARQSDLTPYHIPNIVPPTTKQQMRTLTTLLDRCQSAARTVRGLLGTIVLNEPLAIINCNNSIAERLRFLQGLLSLLPPPARAQITFVTHVVTGQNSPAQIKFLARGAVPPEKHQVFNWETGELTTTPTPKEPYSGFAVGRMQLDPIGLSRSLNEMADTTRHHLEQSTSLADALAQVARRATMDTALAEGQPLYREDVVDVLQNDPTLKKELRAEYAEYLLKVTLALNEPEPADVLAPLVQEDRVVATVIFQQLERAAREGQAVPAFQLLKRWLKQSPSVAETWSRIFGVVALAYQREMVERQDSEAVASLLEELEMASATLEFSQVMDDLLQASMPLARKNSRIARSTLRLAAQHLEPRDFDRLLNDEDFVNQLPAPVQTAMACLDPDEPIEGTGRGVLLRASKALGERGDTVLVRFAENAVAIQRKELIDVPALESLRNLAQSAYAGRFSEILHQTVWALVRSSELTTLPEPGPLLLAQILYLIDRSDDLAQLLQRYQHMLFGEARLDEFRQLVRALFQVTHVSTTQAIDAVKALEISKFDRHALALAYRSVLHTYDWDPSVEHAVDGLLSLLDERADLALTLGFPFTVELFRYVAENGKREDLMRVASPLFEHLPADTSQSVPVLRRIWPLLAKDMEMREAAIDLLRTYARRISEKEITKLLRLYSSKRTRREREALQAIRALYPIFVSRDLLTFSEEVTQSVDLLSDLVVSFEYNQPPHPKALTRELTALTGALSTKEIALFSSQALALADHIEQLGRAHSHDNTKESLLANQAVPRSGIGVIYWLGGYFAEGDQEERDIDRHGLPHPFGNRSLPILYREIVIAAELVGDLLKAFPVEQPPELDLAALRTEVDSRWKSSSVLEQRRQRVILARDCQTLAQLLNQVAHTGGSTTFLGADVSKQVIQGKVAPQSVIDVLRWIGGFYAGKHPK